VSIVGAKAARLAVLLAAGYRVAPGFCVPYLVYQRHVCTSETLAGLLAAGQYEEARRQIRELPLQPDSETAIVSAFREFQARHGRTIIVRSSATAEDLDGFSFAGLYQSCAQVRSERELLDAVRTCWASYWSDEAVAYRQRAGLELPYGGMGVLVQEMITPRVGGVVFTSDPRDVTAANGVIELLPHDVEGIVSGARAAFRLTFDRKTKALGALPDSVPVSHTLLPHVVQLAMDIEARAGTPQDIEWAADAETRVWLFQTRPIPVNGADTPSADGWTLVYDEPFSPLGCDLAKRRYAEWVKARNAFYKTRYPVQIEERRGLLYYRPGWRSSDWWMRSWMRSWQVVRWLTGPRIHDAYVRRILPDHLVRLEHLEAGAEPGLAHEALRERFAAAVDAYLRLQATSYAVGALATTSAALLDRLCVKWCATAGAGPRVLDLLAGVEDVSITRERAVLNMADQLRSVTDARELRAADYPGLRCIAARQPGLSQALDALLESYGYLWADRYPRDPAWQINVASLTASLAAGVERGGVERLAERRLLLQRQRDAAGRQAEQALASSSLRRLLFRIARRRAERYFGHKEDRNHWVYVSLTVVRRYAVLIGNALAAAGTLRAPDDVFFLTASEIDRLLDGHVDDGLQVLVRKRRATYQRAIEPAPRRGTAAGVSHAATSPRERVELIGDACSPGAAAGRARVISGPGELQRVGDGDIVVCRELRPAWSTVFARAGAVVVESGSVLSHGSTLAREYGIPAVINVPDLTRRIREEDWIAVDGDRGSVTIGAWEPGRHEAAAAPAETRV
jgi:pyruvate,water dikinase